jgi:hypothetical protein
MEEIFESSVRSAGDLAGVFEFDGDTSYFYLYRVDASEGNKVLDAIKVSVGEPDYAESDIEIRWSADESLVFLQIAGQTCAVFDCEGAQKFGGDYVAGVAPKVPPGILARLLPE